MTSLTKDTSVKLSLGKHIILCFLHILILQAGDFEYSITVDNANPYVKEGILLNIELNQTNHDIVLLFDFDLVKSKSYTFQRVAIEETDAYHAAHIRYTYLVYPLKEGTVPIHFTLTQKATTDESVAYSFSGDRDNVKGLVTTDTPIKVTPLILDVKPLPLNTELVGNFSLDFHVEKHKALAFEPLPLQIIIQGKGYPPVLKHILPLEGNFTRFTEAPVLQTKSTIQGTDNTVTYAIALSSDKSFTLPARNINAFNPKNEKSYTLTIPEQHFYIKENVPSTLLDNADNPPPLILDFHWLETLLSYVLVFFAGYFSAYVLKWSRQTKKQMHPLSVKIQGANSHKQLLQVLLSQDNKQFSPSIEKLEQVLYKNESIPLRSIKQEVIKQLTNERIT